MRLLFYLPLILHLLSSALWRWIDIITMSWLNLFLILLGIKIRFVLFPISPDEYSSHVCADSPFDSPHHYYFSVGDSSQRDTGCPEWIDKMAAVRGGGIINHHIHTETMNAEQDMYTSSSAHKWYSGTNGYLPLLTCSPPTHVWPLIIVTKMVIVRRTVVVVVHIRRRKDDRRSIRGRADE